MTCSANGRRFPKLLSNSSGATGQNGTLWINDPDGVVLEKRDMSSYRRGRYRRRICELSDAEFEFHKAYIIACGGVVTSGDLLTEISERNLDVLRKMMKEVGTAAKFDDTTFTIRSESERGHTLICAFNWTEEAARSCDSAGWNVSNPDAVY